MEEVRKRQTTKEFILSLIKISFPIILGNLFTNLASLIDTLMVGQLDEVNLSGVYIATEIIFVINLGLFGSVEGASVYFCQFLGKKDNRHLRNTFAYKIISSVLIGLIGMLIVLVFGRNLASLFTNDEKAIEIALSYMQILTISFIPYGLSIAISTSLRESHHSTIPMIITLIGIFINVLLNYIFIFGSWGAPALGPIGAAIGTISERLFELVASILVLLKLKPAFAENILKAFKIPKNLLKNLTIKSIPLLFNEILWSLGQTGLVYVLTQKSQIATSALPIVTTIFNLLFVVTLGLGNGISILIGNIIGANDLQDAQKKAYISIVFTLIESIVIGLILFFISPLVVSFYSKVSEETRDVALTLLRFNGLYIVITSINTVLFFLLRSGGRTYIVFLFDSCYGWLISIPGAFLFYKLIPGLSFEQLYICVYLLDLLKSIFGFILLFSKKWHKNIINQYEEAND